MKTKNLEKKKFLLNYKGNKYKSNTLIGVVFNYIFKKN